MAGLFERIKNDVHSHYAKHGLGGFVPPELKSAFNRVPEAAQFYAENMSDASDMIEVQGGLKDIYNAGGLNADAARGYGRLGTGLAALAVPFVGAGIFAGKGAKTADVVALSKAEEMDAAGKSADDIWNETGWFKGADDKWRFEIDDSEAFVKGGDISASESARRWGPSFVDYQDKTGVMTHEGLVDAYPDMSKVQFDGMPGRGGMLQRAELLLPDAEGNLELPSMVTVGDDLRGGAKTSVALHEGQHDIQYKEGFAQGGSADFIKLGGEDKQFDMARKAYEDSAGDAELLYELGAGPKPSGKSQKPWGELTRREQVKWLERGRERAYRRLAGEVEARNVQTRMNMTPDERKAKPPWTTEDVPRTEQIVRFK